MPGGRPPKPTAALRLHGGLIPGRHDNRAREPMPEGDAFQVIALEGEALAAWEHLHPRLIAVGLATELDSHELCALCHWWGEYRKWCQMESENEYRRMVGMAAAYKQFRVIAAKFGITPSDRVGLVGSLVTQEDELEDLIAS